VKVTVPDRRDDATSGQLGQSLLFCGKASGGLERASNQILEDHSNRAPWAATRKSVCVKSDQYPEDIVKCGHAARRQIETASG
jgi:hypothetical protein